MFSAWPSSCSSDFPFFHEHVPHGYAQGSLKRLGGGLTRRTPRESLAERRIVQVSLPCEFFEREPAFRHHSLNFCEIVFHDVSNYRQSLKHVNKFFEVCGNAG